MVPKPKMILWTDLVISPLAGASGFAWGEGPREIHWEKPEPLLISSSSHLIVVIIKDIRAFFAFANWKWKHN